MIDLVRRSIFTVPASDRDAIEDSWRHNADAIMLVLDDDIARRAAARERLPDAISAAARGGAEVFVRVEADLMRSDIAAAASPGLTGIVLVSAKTAGAVEAASQILSEFEETRGFPILSLQIFLLISSAAAVWDIRSLLAASSRTTSAALDCSRLCADLGVMPNRDFDPFLFAAGRLVIECTAAGVQAVGISHPLSVAPRRLGEAEIARLAERGRNSGFKGAFCPDPSWIAPCNRAFTPTDEQVEYYRTVRRLFAEGLAQGRAAVPIEGRMIDVPVDERARIQIALWERCQRREAEKAAALSASLAATA